MNRGILLLTFVLVLFGKISSDDGISSTGRAPLAIPEDDFIEDSAEELSKTGRTKTKLTETLKEKFKAARTSIKENVKSVSGYDKHQATDGTISVMVGMTSLVNGIKSGDSMAALSGVFGISSGVATLIAAGMTGPLAPVAATVLNFLSLVFTWLGGYSETSYEEYFERALKEAAIQDIKKTIKGSLNAYRSLGASIQNFRKLNENSQEHISEEQANAIYTQLFKELDDIGALKEDIERYCKSEKIDDQITNDIKDNAETCTEFLGLYVELMVRRKLLLLDASVVIRDAANQTSDQALLQTANNVLHILSTEEERDKDVFQFLLYPVNYREHGYSISLFYKYPVKNALVITYLKALCKRFRQDCPPTLTACTEKFLQGQCTSFEEQAELDLSLITNDFKSYALPPYTVINVSQSDMETGPQVIHNQPLLFKDKSKLTIRSTTPDEENELYVRVCATDNKEFSEDDPQSFIYQDCSQVSEGEVIEQPIEFISIPTGLALKSKGTKEFTFYGPYNGRRGFCLEDDASYEVIKVDTSIKFVQVCYTKKSDRYCANIPVINTPERNPTSLLKDILTLCKKSDYDLWYENAKNMIIVPENVHVTLNLDRDKISGQFGPIKGPVSITDTIWKVYKKWYSGGRGSLLSRYYNLYEWKFEYIKVVDVKTQIELCSKGQFLGDCYTWPIFQAEDKNDDEKEYNLPDQFQPASYCIPDGVQVEFTTDSGKSVVQGVKASIAPLKATKFKISFLDDDKENDED